MGRRAGLPVFFLFALGGGPALLAVGLLALSRAGDGPAGAVNDIILYTLTQTIPPPAVRGRVNATVRVAAYGAMAAGALLGGDGDLR